LITYNKCSFLYNIPKICNHKNKIHIIRTGANFLHFDNKITNYLKNCKKIYIIALSINDDFINKYILNKFNNYKIINISNENNIYSELKKNNFYLANNSKCPQTGLLSYLYLKYNFNNFNNIKKYLCGFTNDYTNQNSKLWIGHSKELEQKYYKNELLIDSNLIKIDNVIQQRLKDHTNNVNKKKINKDYRRKIILNNINK